MVRNKVGGGVIKAGMYKWVDEPDVSSIVQLIGAESPLSYNFETDNNQFSGISLYDYNGTPNWGIAYNNLDGLHDLYNSENYTNHTNKNDLIYCGYSNQKKQFGQYGRPTIDSQKTYEWVEVVAYKTFTITEDYDLSSEWPDTESEQAILTWFAANTTKLS